MTAGGRTRRIGLIAALMLCMAEVSAQGMGRPPRDRDGPRQQRIMPESRPTQFAPEGGAARQRMTPEERRKLRQDVHDAGRDLYPDRMRERRREFRRGE